MLFLRNISRLTFHVSRITEGWSSRWRAEDLRGNAVLRERRLNIRSGPGVEFPSVTEPLKRGGYGIISGTTRSVEQGGIGEEWRY